MSLINTLSRPFPRARRSLIDTVRALDALRRQRRQLAALDDYALLDLGLTRSEAETEANRPLWDSPLNWRQ